MRSPKPPQRGALARSQKPFNHPCPCGPLLEGGKSLKFRLRLRKNHLGVSPVIATILMVAITVVLAAVLYALIQNVLVPPGASHPTVALENPTHQPDGTWTVSIQVANPVVALSNYQVSVISGSTVVFNTTDLANGSLGTKGGITITFVDADQSRTLNAGDFFVIAGLRSGSNYEFRLSWKPGGFGVIASKPINA